MDMRNVAQLILEDLLAFILVREIVYLNAYHTMECELVWQKLERTA